MNRFKITVIPFIIVIMGMTACAQDIVVNNVQPRMTENGKIVDAHDGRVIKFGDTFYWYGTTYGNTNGFTSANHYSCYSSKDLKVWKKEGKLLPNQPEGVYYRPHVVYNAKTKNYVLWYNWYPKLWNGQFGVATSKQPTGPFKIINDNVKMVRSDVGLGDFGLFVDDDGTCYLSYNTIQNHQVSIEKLNKDYTASTMENGGIIAEHMEAGTQFKRNGSYYLMTDYTCCFCNYGSGARVYRSNDPMTGYQLTGNINRYPGRLALPLTDGVERGTQYETLHLTDEQNEHLIVDLNENTALESIRISLFTGNRPENCGNVENPRVHPEITEPNFKVSYWDYSEWKALSINEMEVVKSALSQVITLKMNSQEIRRLKIEVLTDDYPYEELFVNEVALHTKSNKVTTMKVYVSGDNIPQKPIIPAQQSYVMALDTEKGKQFIWMGDLWGSASDNVKGHDYQFWSAPLEFFNDGTVKPLEWTDQWRLSLPKN